MRISFCKQCGKECSHLTMGYCKKHYWQLIKFGKCLDSNSRTIFDSNEIRIKENYAEIDTYDAYGNIFKTYLIDIEDIPFLSKYKWRTIVKKEII